ncbi:hypothetical protein V5O48_011494 [Marasmius crinis-equi]|uniref:F-box domain-containing protein n=1 Tax=Marasmius crinis-equi TaxID=585013 RepID=A0ABR3F5F4_9AGAR
MMRRKEGIKRWLERSGSLPLNISISTGSSSRLPSIDGQTQDIAILADVLRVFSMHSHRWRSVIFTGDPQAKSPAIWAPFAELKKDELPQLQDFRTFSSLMSFDSRWQIVPTTLASLVTRSTSLTTLHVTNEQSISTILELQVSWTSIKELHLTSSESERWDPALITRKVAKLCPSLVSFKLKLWTSWISGSTTTSHPLLPSLHWPRLRSFDLTIVDCQRDHLNKKLSGAFWRALQGMTAPALTHLSLKAEVARASCYPRHELSSAVGVPAVEPVSRLPFQDMISESGCTISHLSLSGIFLMDEGALIHALELVPSLTSLTLTDCANRIFIVPLGHNPTIPHHKLAACLNSLSSSADLCPDIAEMSISACQIDNIEPIVSFAKARSTKLKRLSVDFGAITKEGGDKVAQITSSTDISDSLHHLRENRGIKVDWKWTASKFSLNETYNMHSRPYTGMEIQN